jgi:hypothetical protein
MSNQPLRTWSGRIFLASPRQAALTAMARRVNFALALGSLLALGGCSDPSDPGPLDPADPSLVRVDVEPPGQRCASGGSAVHVGLDHDGDGVLDDGEIDSSTYVCDPDALIRSDDELAGPHCAAGGTAIHAGGDRNGNGALDDDEITSTTYVCDDELTPLLSHIDDEPAGSNCAAGGTAIRAGLDLDGDGALDHAEVLRVDYVCDQKQLVRIDAEPAGPNCATGGVAVRLGADLDGSGTLEEAEVTGTEYVCDGIVTGNLEIYDADDLAALADVNVVTGNVYVSGLLPDAGDVVFPALRMIGGSFDLMFSDSATSVSLPALEILGGGMRIERNDLLASIAFPALRRAGTIDIIDNAALITVDLGGLDWVDSWLSIRDSPILNLNLGALDSAANIDLWNLAAATIALPDLNQVDELILAENAFTSFSAPQLSLVRRDVVIANNPSLASLSFPSLATIGRSLFVQGHDALASFALPALTDLGEDLRIRNNAALTGFALPGLRTVGGHLWIMDNDALLGLDGLAALETVVYNFLFHGNASVVDLSGLGQLRRVGMSVEGFRLEVRRSRLQRLALPNLVEVQDLLVRDFVQGNPELETIDLPRLRHAQGIWLSDAPVATRFDMPQLEAVWVQLVVLGSPSMPTCRAEALVAQLAVVGDVWISGTDDAATCD